MSNWSVIRTRSRWEKKVAALLVQKGIETYCPLQKARSQWSDRVKTIEKPLLKTYVFAKVDDSRRTDVRLTEGVINFVYRNGKPVLVKEKLIQGIQHFQTAHTHVEVIETAVANGAVKTVPGAMRAKGPALWIELLDLVLVAGPQPQLIEATTDKI